jgi:uncharacterized pyridoxamine 5'-phosphate oxidase family protein
MTHHAPTEAIDVRYSSEGAVATRWDDARRELEEAGVYWITTVRPDGRPHVTTLIAVWVDDALYLCTGAEERKAKNLAQNPHCIFTTGCNTYEEGLDVVVESDAVNVRDDGLLQRVADAYETKYGSEWHFDVRDGAFHHDAGAALVFEAAPTTVFGFRKGEPFSQTRWRFDS